MAAQFLVADHRLSRSRACAAVGLSRSSWYRASPQQHVRDQAVIDALNAMVEKRPRWGFWKCYDRLRLESYGQIWCMPMKSSGDLVLLFDLFSVNELHACNDLRQVCEAA